MNYKNWMKKNYGDANTPKGDFARDIMGDKSFPKNGVGKFDEWHETISNYIVGCGACVECIEVFDESWKEYEECERKRLNR